MTLGVVILAAGQGTRMRSERPKVLHLLAGQPLLGHVIESAAHLEPRSITVVHGHGGERVRERFASARLQWAEQAEQLGTGHAVQQAMPLLDPAISRVLILYGDVPLIEAATLQQLVATMEHAAVGLLTVELDDATGYGRILRDAAGRVVRIVEHKDASETQRHIHEINTGILAVDRHALARWLDRLGNDNAQREYYLTDIIAMAAQEGVGIATAEPASPYEVMGVNDRTQLAMLERHYQQCAAERLMREGTTLADPGRFDLRGTLKTGRDCFIDINVVIEGVVALGDRVVVGPNTVLRDSRIGDDVEIQPNCVIEQAEVGNGARIGPFARLRPLARLAADTHVGNFVEIKKATIGEGSKVNHLSYIGDAEIGAGVNVGAGTITCNYDGANKHRTVIGDRAFIGSNTALVAPVTVQAGATIGAGSVITKEAPADKLTLTRARQTTVDGWQRPVKPPKD